MSGVQVVRYDDLEPQWHVPGAREPGFMRWLISWVGGPTGFVNPSKEAAVINENTVVGLMNLLEGQQQKGLHYHSVAEIYVILKGELESYDGRGETHRAGVFDCIYIPAGVPHGVRNCGREDCELLWVHDGIEKIGTSVYYMDGIVTGPPQIDDISIVSFGDLEPKYKFCSDQEEPVPYSLISWVGGISAEYVNHNRGVAVPSERVGLGMTILRSGQEAPLEINGVGTCYVIAAGTATFKMDGRIEEVSRLDGIWVPRGNVHSISNLRCEALHLLWVHERPEKVH